MKVKISYTVDLENIPAIIKQMASDAKIKAREVLDTCEELSACGDYGVKSLNQISNARANLSNLSDVTSEMQGILTGLLQTLGSQSDTDEQQPQTQETVNQPAPSQDQISDIASKIEQLRNMASNMNGGVKNDNIE